MHTSLYTDVCIRLINRLDDSGKQYLSRNIIVRFRNAIFGLRSVEDRRNVSPGNIELAEITPSLLQFNSIVFIIMILGDLSLFYEI